MDGGLEENEDLGREVVGSVATAGIAQSTMTVDV